MNFFSFFNSILGGRNYDHDYYNDIVNRFLHPIRKNSGEYGRKSRFLASLRYKNNLNIHNGFNKVSWRNKADKFVVVTFSNSHGDQFVYNKKNGNNGGGLLGSYKDFEKDLLETFS